MKKLNKGYVIGIILSGVLLFGGWYVYGAPIDSRIGLNVLAPVPASGTTTNIWWPVRDASQLVASNNIVTGILAAAPACHVAGGNNWQRCATSSNSTASFTEPNALYPVVAAAISGCGGGVCSPVEAAATNSDSILAPGASDALTTLSFTTALDPVTGFFIRIRGTAANGLSVDPTRNPQFTQSTTGVIANSNGTTLTTTGAKSFTLIVDRTVGATDAVEIDVHCSMDGVIWPANTFEVMSVTTLAVEPARVSTTTSNIPCAFIRWSIVTVGAGNTLTLQLVAS